MRHVISENTRLLRKKVNARKAWKIEGSAKKIDGLLDVGKLVANWFPGVFGCLRALQERMADKKMPAEHIWFCRP